MYVHDKKMKKNHDYTQFGCVTVACWSEGYTLTAVARYVMAGHVKVCVCLCVVFVYIHVYSEHACITSVSSAHSLSILPLSLDPLPLRSLLPP